MDKQRRCFTRENGSKSDWEHWTISDCDQNTIAWGNALLLKGLRQLNTQTLKLIGRDAAASIQIENLTAVTLRCI